MAISAFAVLASALIAMVIGTRRMLASSTRSEAIVGLQEKREGPLPQMKGVMDREQHIEMVSANYSEQEYVRYA